MAKSTSGTKLLRDLARAAKAQRRMVARLLDIYTLTPPAAPRSPAPARPKPRTASAVAKPARAPSTRAAKPGPAPAAGQWLAQYYSPPSVPGNAPAHGIDYWLYLPPTLPAGAAPHGTPLIVMLHGCHQSAIEFAQGTRMNHLAGAKGYAVLYPQQRMSAHAHGCWRWFDRAAQEGHGEAGVLAALVGHVRARHGIDRRRIYACGLSAGAGMAAVLALTHPDLFAAVGLHSGPVFGAGHTPAGALHVMRHGAQAQADLAIRHLLARRAAQPLQLAAGTSPLMPALLIHGADDPVVSQVNQQQLTRQWLLLNGLPLGPANRTDAKPAGQAGSSNAHEIHDFTLRRKVILRVVRIAGLRHAWSGGDPAFKFNAKARPDASRLVLDFFGRHRR